LTLFVVRNDCQVVDIDPETGRKSPRYLIYDLVALYGQPVGKREPLNIRLKLAREVCVTDKDHEFSFLQTFVACLSLFSFAQLFIFTYLPISCTLFVANETFFSSAQHVVNPRHRIDRTKDPFGVRVKDFWPIQDASKIFPFMEKLSHETDGLIITPVCPVCAVDSQTRCGNPATGFRLSWVHGF
jgi:hypothetical protein